MGIEGRDPVRVLMERHGWDFAKARQHVRRACQYLRGSRLGVPGPIPQGTKRHRFEAIATLQALLDCDHASVEGLEL